MIDKIKDLISNFSKKEESNQELSSSLLDNACAALLVEIAFADKDFDDTEKDSLRETLIQTYGLNEKEIEEIIEDADRSVEESTSLYGYTRIVNDEFDYEDKLDSLLQSSVKNQLISDVPLGILLSGGLDSSLIASIASKFKKKLNTYSVSFIEKNYDESDKAKTVSKLINSNHNEYSCNMMFKVTLKKLL